MPLKKISKGRSTSRKTKQPTGRPKPSPQAPTQSITRRRESSKPVIRQKPLKTVLAGPKKHTRSSRGSPLWEKQDDIQKLTGRGKQGPEISSRTAKPPTRVKPRIERERHWEPGVPSIFQPLPSIEAAFEETLGSRRTLDFTSPTFQSEETNSLDSETLPWSRELPDAEEILLQRNGYIPPFSNEVLAAIHIILGIDAAQEMGGISAYSSEFEKTLEEDRNVLLKETKHQDPEWAYLEQYQINRDADEASVADFLDRLWSADLSFCKNQQEAIFQRTAMMNMINRHHLIFLDNKMLNELSESPLMFSVEAPWDCPPMPTARFKRALINTNSDRNDKEPKIYTTAARPDLCISFRTSTIISPDLWKKLPQKTQHLICYEGIKENKKDRAFGFFFVEAKRSGAEPDDKIALIQALNSASQALHNIHEFFKEAEEIAAFFKHVRVFSATTSEKGAIIRVHRAVELPTDTELCFNRVVEDYPLQFEYQIYKSFAGENFSRLEVIQAFEKIIKGYGEKQLLVLLRQAEVNVRKKAFSAWKNSHTIPLETAFNDYRYGQSGKPGSNISSKAQTPAVGDSRRGSSMSMPPPNVSRSIRERYKSDEAEINSQASGESTLGQGGTGFQVDAFNSQHSKSSGRRGRAISPAKQHESPRKKRKTKER
ncbi:MAG: hypothetical protein Q9227_003752 [Pyrenula ochraceoflavens]